MKQAMTLPPVIEREYGGYHAKICFAPQDVPDAEKNLLDSIMQAYRVRIERQMG